MQPQILFLTLIFSHSKLLPIVLGQRAEFGNHCNSTVKCDNRAWLSCQEDRCQCIFPDEMEYDLTKKKCLSKAGERCKFQISNMDTDSGLLSLYDQTDCVENGFCGRDGLCICWPGFYESFNGSCEPQKGNNETCAMDSECSQDNYLSCINFKCACSAAQLEENGHCIGKAGTAMAGQPCVTGSILVNNTVCVCMPIEEYYAGEDGKCHKKKDYGEPCSRDAQCFSDTFLKCANGVCGCGENTIFTSFETLPAPIIYSPISCLEYFQNNITELGAITENYCPAFSGEVLCKNGWKCIPETQLCDGTNDCEYGDSEDEDPRLCSWCSEGKGKLILPDPRKARRKGRCVGRASKPCNPDAQCETSTQCSHGFCNCNDRLIYKPSTGTCVAQYGGPCSEGNAECGDNFVCNEGICKCPSHDQTFEASQANDKCLSLIHGSCDSDTDCILTAECKTNPLKPFKQCQCGAGYVENQKRSCDLAHGAYCLYKQGWFQLQIQIQCDQLAKLECINRKCSCPSLLSQYDPVERKCLGLDGAPCPDYPNSTKLCVDNAVCQSSHPDLQPICTCSPGFNSTENRFCVKDDTTNFI